jgi:hypothetical protein
VNSDDLNTKSALMSSSSSFSNHSKQQKQNDDPKILIIGSSQKDESESPPILLNKNKLDSFKSLCLENDTVQHMKMLDINNDLNSGNAANNNGSCSNQPPSSGDDTCDLNFKLNLNDSNSRNYLWNLLKSHSTLDEIKTQFGSMLHDKITFWDLVEMKLKFTQGNQLKTTYEIIDEYTLLYSNMSTLLEKIVKEHSKGGSGFNSSGKKVFLSYLVSKFSFCSEE